MSPPKSFCPWVTAKKGHGEEQSPQDPGHHQLNSLIVVRKGSRKNRRGKRNGEGNEGASGSRRQRDNRPPQQQGLLELRLGLRVPEANAHLTHSQGGGGGSSEAAEKGMSAGCVRLRDSLGSAWNHRVPAPKGLCCRLWWMLPQAEHLLTVHHHNSPGKSDVARRLQLYRKPGTVGHTCYPITAEAGGRGSRPASATY